MIAKAYHYYGKRLIDTKETSLSSWDYSRWENVHADDSKIVIIIIFYYISGFLLCVVMNTAHTHFWLLIVSQLHFPTFLLKVQQCVLLHVIVNEYDYNMQNLIIKVEFIRARYNTGHGTNIKNSPNSDSYIFIGLLNVSHD